VFGNPAPLALCQTRSQTLQISLFIQVSASLIYGLPVIGPIISSVKVFPVAACAARPAPLIILQPVVAPSDPLEIACQEWSGRRARSLNTLTVAWSQEMRQQILRHNAGKKSRACDPALCVSADIYWAFAII
jgi:hypothetical protein